MPARILSAASGACPDSHAFSASDESNDLDPKFSLKLTAQAAFEGHAFATGASGSAQDLD